MASLFRVAAARHAAALRCEVEVVDRAARPRDAVLVFAADGRVLIVVVGVVRSDLRCLVNRAVERGRERIGVLDEGFERRASEAAEIPEALGAVERAVGRALGQNRLTGALQPVAEFLPGLPGHQAICSRLFRHRALLLPVLFPVLLPVARPPRSARL